MHVRSLMAAVAVAAMTTTLGTVLGAAPAQAGETRTLSGPSTGDAGAYLTFVRCDDLFGAEAATAPRSRLNLGPYAAPLGRRSLGLVPAAAGSAAGPYAGFSSLTALDTSLSVAATGGSQGVSWLVAVTPTTPRGAAWSGRAAVSVAPGAWAHVAPAALTHEWTLVDLTTGAALDRATDATPGGFAAEHGDGPGFAVTGFGCDGRPFNLDAVRASGTTFDFEAVALTTSVAVDATSSEAGEEVTVSGTVTDAAGRFTGDPLVLQTRSPGGEWTSATAPVLADREGVSRTTVRLDATTELRWHRPESQYADEGWSDPVTVTVEPQADAPEPSEDPTPSEAPAQQ
ncbi:hypothetical protein GCM10011376_32890 [Nocardioides flavus (ex Wang et al. 2016)]|uniref:Htaa protein n=1 Tax=Nocardioides flavus (ex Wang et al. 2016) TaxID=2058780 RepID=A0ABQ3HR79_9ACTN|nr:hypothetical protein [Nocardioides flavus (ex Wang et al. 2016)]GHE18679.1 hypothetical protein GCM10011376_32890 [Nocardioides flavus (ex Wang et al. 2016)]